MRTQAVSRDLKFAGSCVRVGNRFSFTDSSGRSHGDFEIDNPISPAPKNAIGAIKVQDFWLWVIDEIDWQQRAIAAEQERDYLRGCLDARARVQTASDEHWHLAISKLKHLWDNGFFPGIEGLCDKLLETIAAKEAAEQTIGQLKGLLIKAEDRYVITHSPLCRIGRGNPCDCGLYEFQEEFQAALRKDGE